MKNRRNLQKKNGKSPKKMKTEIYLKNKMENIDVCMSMYCGDTQSQQTKFPSTPYTRIVYENLLVGLYCVSSPGPIRIIIIITITVSEAKCNVVMSNAGIECSNSACGNLQTGNKMKNKMT